MKYVLSCFWSIIVFTACPTGTTDDTTTQSTDAGIHTTDAGSGPCEQSEEVCGVAPEGKAICVKMVKPGRGLGLVSAMRMALASGPLYGAQKNNKAGKRR